MSMARNYEIFMKALDIFLERVDKIPRDGHKNKWKLSIKNHVTKGRYLTVHKTGQERIRGVNFQD